jgi:lysophospholipase-2
MSAVPPVVLKASSRHTSTLIFLHGLGDTGHGWASALQAIKPPHLKVVCPTAPVQPVTLNNGFRMPSWYDIRALDEEDYSRREDAAGVDASSRQLEKWIDEEVTADVPREKILIGGFSQVVFFLSNSPYNEIISEMLHSNNETC